MSQTTTDLVHEFPEYKEKIHTLKVQGGHFLNLFNSYHDVSREIHRIESGVQQSADDYTENLKKERLRLKDEIFSILRKAA